MSRNLNTLNSISDFSFLSEPRLISPCVSFDTVGELKCHCKTLRQQNEFRYTCYSFLPIQEQQCQRFCKGYEINLHSEEFFKAAEFNRKEMSQLPSAHDRVRSPGNDESNHVDHRHLQSFHHLWLWLWLWWWFWFWWRSVPSSLVDRRSPGGLMTRESVAAGFSVKSHCCRHSQLDFYVALQIAMAKCKCKCKCKCK